VSSFTGSLFGAPAAATPTRATGGPVWAGQPFLVGERGPEFFVPDRSGAVLPTGAMPGGGGGGILYAPTINVDARGSQLSGPEISAIVRTASDNARRELVETVRRDPGFARQIRGR
jgi:phage-related minor tail protein